MFSKSGKSVRMAPLFLLVVLSLVLVACGGLAADCTQANVETVQVEEEGGEYTVVVTGWFPNACTRMGDSEQKVVGDTIIVTLCSESPEDLVCAQMLTTFEESIPLDTSDLEPGEEYTVVVNGISASFTLD